jgi:copper chaperone
MVKIEVGRSDGPNIASTYPRKEALMSTTATTTVTVTGMTCGHCVSSVREELSALPGVTDVSVDLASGRVDIDSAAPLDRGAIAAAVDEAGYRLAD